MKPKLAKEDDKRTAAAVNKPTPRAATSDDVSMRKSVAPAQKKNSIFIHGILLNT